ncbi:CBS domain-containing protein [Amycolatopsis cihanbeyliensis]|uniref:CBS domain-containing protein n=1 Tax=Amycolatopsis cihanbeyliensis TaxID=1128664 RepID=UPI00319E9685
MINFLLAVFNLIPAAPLDGGRILRAVLWGRLKDRNRAAVWSARAGRGFGFALILLGVVVVVTGTLSGLWWMLIGWFIVTVASAEERQADMGSVLAGLRVRDVMTPDPDTANAELSVADFIRDVAMVRRHSAFPLREPGDGIQGMITLGRLKAVSAERRAETRLHEAACPMVEVPTARPDEELVALLPRMYGCADGRALVFDNGDLVGIVSPTDISRAVSLRGLGVSWRDGADLTSGGGGGWGRG